VVWVTSARSAYANEPHNLFFHFRLLACSLLLATLPHAQRPGAATDVSVLWHHGADMPRVRVVVGDAHARKRQAAAAASR
jgi:hypothetical protein